MNINNLIKWGITGCGGWLIYSFVFLFLVDPSKISPGFLLFGNISKWISLIIGMISFFLIPLVMYMDNHKAKPSGGNYDEPHHEKSSGERDDLTKKLAVIRHKENEIIVLLTRGGLKEAKIKMLTGALEFLESQKITIEARKLSIDYLAWEQSALTEYQNLSALDYATGRDDWSVAQKIMMPLVETGDEYQAEWNKLAKTHVQETALKVLPRLEQILSVCRKLLDELENYEIAGVLRDVRQVEAGSPLLLPENTVAESMRILQEISARPLDQDLLFQHLRIKSLDELNENFALKNIS